MKECCKQCRFWKQKPHDETVGSCRRYPPSLIQHVVAVEGKEDSVESIEAAWQWEAWAMPQVVDDHWCGEFKPFDEKAPTTPTNPTELVKNLSADGIKKRLEEIDNERSGLLTLLRIATRAKKD